MSIDEDKWSRRFVGLAHHVAAWSKDPSTKVGAVIVDDLRRVIGMGYNGFPRGVQDTSSRYEDREQKYRLVVHAEANAILNVMGPATGSTLYTTHFPCAECAKLIIQAGISEVVCDWRNNPDRNEKLSHWRESADAARTMFLEAGVCVSWVQL